MLFRGFLEHFHPPTGDIDFGAVGGEGLAGHETNACAAAGDEAHAISQREEVAEVERFC